MMKSLFALLCIAGLAVSSQAAEVTLVEGDSGYEVHIDGQLFTRYVTDQGNKPYFWPIIGPTGKEMTRAYPMEDREGEKQDHPHHRSMWFGHQDIGGFDTWHEQLTMEERAKGDEEKLASMMAGLGQTTTLEVIRAESLGDAAVLEITHQYSGRARKTLLRDSRTYSFFVLEDGSRVIDVEILFEATEGGSKLGDKKDAGFSLRVAHSMCVDAGEGGTIINSHGDTDKDAWGKRAEWVDFNGPVEGEHLGIAVLDCPQNFRYPSPWHVRTYGLFTCNPFGMESVLKEEESGAVELAEGEMLQLRYRVIFHEGDEKDANIAEAFETWHNKWSNPRHDTP